VNELISACAFNEIANGVGPYSFTSALVTELRLLSPRPSFSVGELYKRIFFRTQCRMPEELYEDGTERERHPAPIHLVLTQTGPIPRSIQLPTRIGSQNINKTSGTSLLVDSDHLSMPSSILKSVRGAAYSKPMEFESPPPDSPTSQRTSPGPMNPRLLFAVRRRRHSSLVMT
jgi:hypothetical protein